MDVLGHGLPQGSLARLIAVPGVWVLIGRRPGRVGVGAPRAQETPGMPAVGVRVPVGVSVLG
jgi:hypothetical protein